VEESRVKTPSDVTTAVSDSYCPVTLELVTGDATTSPFACACPQCGAVLVKTSVGNIFYWHCDFCAWRSNQGTAEASALKVTNRASEGIADLVSFYEEQAAAPLRGSALDEDFAWRWTDCEAKTNRRSQAPRRLPLLGLVVRPGDPVVAANSEPVSVRLRARTTVRCTSCAASLNKPNLLLKPHAEPLKGDSRASAPRDVGLWFQKKSLAYDYMPRIVVDTTGAAGMKTATVVNPLQVSMHVLLDNKVSVVIPAAGSGANRVVVDWSTMASREWTAMQVNAPGVFKAPVDVYVSVSM